MVRAVAAVAFIVKLAVVPRIIVAVIVATVVAAASEDAVRRSAFSLLGEIIQDGCANQYIKESHKIIDLRLISPTCHLTHDFNYEP